MSSVRVPLQAACVWDRWSKEQRGAAVKMNQLNLSKLPKMPKSFPPPLRLPCAGGRWRFASYAACVCVVCSLGAHAAQLSHGAQSCIFCRCRRTAVLTHHVWQGRIGVRSRGTSADCRRICASQPLHVQCGGRTPRCGLQPVIAPDPPQPRYHARGAVVRKGDVIPACRDSSFSLDDHVHATLSRLTVLGIRLGGMSNVVKGEGTHFKMPWLQRPYIFNVRSTPRNIKSITGSRDLQMIDINLRIIYRPQIDKLPEMYRTLGLDYDERLSPSLHVALRAPSLVLPCSPKPHPCLAHQYALYRISLQAPATEIWRFQRWLVARWCAAD